MINSSARRESCASCRPAIRVRIVPATSVGVVERVVEAGPNNHLSSGPNCCVTGSSGGRCTGTRRNPVVGIRIVSPTTLEIVELISSTPDDHLIAGPDCRVESARLRGIRGVSGPPIIRAGIVSPSGIQVVVTCIIEITSPNDHLASCPDRCVAGTSERGVIRSDACPTVCYGGIPSPGIEVCIKISSSPNNHLTTGPHGCVKFSRFGCILSAYSDPAIEIRIVPSAGVVEAAPYDHFATGPY
jgi:hypothetical protein